jgi:DNA primase
MITNQAQEIKSRLDIADIIQEYISLKPAGTHNLKALCPFHNEKTPSLMVSRDKQIWHCFGCFPKGSAIKREDGLVPIEAIKRGDYVISGKGNKKKVLLTMKRDYSGELISIQTRKCNKFITMTADHEVYVVKTKNCKQKSRKTRLCQSNCRQNCPTKYFKNYKIEKVAAKNLTKDDYLLYPIVKKVKDVKSLNLKKYLNRRLTNYGPKIKEVPSKVKIDNNLLKLLGYYIAEGSSHRAYIRFSLGPAELDFAKEIQRLIKKIFNFDSSIHIRKQGKSGIEVSCCNSNLANIFENLCGKGSHNKHIPFELNLLPSKKQKVILEAVFKGDGCTSKGGIKSRAGEKQIATTSIILAHQMKDILLRLNLQPGLSYARERTDKKGVHHKPTFTVRWREDLKGNYTDFYTVNNTNYWLLPIRNIVKKNFKGEVYNLTIADDHSYIANHFAVGNCGKGGDIFTFVQEYDGMSFPEALRHLADRAGVKIVRQNPALVNQKTRLLDLLDLTAKFYQEYLVKKPQADIARKYLEQRGVTHEIIDQFKLGYSPDSWDETKKLLQQKNYNEKEIFLAGLLVKNESNNSLYDRFRGRLMFPIFDHNGAVVGFGGRTLKTDEEKGAKYINSPQTMVYDKSGVVYGLNFAKQEIKKADLTVVVEGYMDVIASHQAGVTNVVGSSGTALTEAQLKLLKRYSNKIALSFDADVAGENAAKRGIDTALLLGMEVRVITLPSGKDPDECIKNNPDDWKKAIESAEEFMEYYFNQTFSRLDTNKVQDKKQAAKILLPIIKKISDLVEQSFWLKKLAGKLDVEEAILRDTLKKVKLPRTNIQATSKPQENQQQISPSLSKSEKTKEERLSEKLLAVILTQPPLLETASDHLTPEMLAGEPNQNLYKSLIIYYTDANNLAQEGIKSFGEYLAQKHEQLVETYNVLELLAAKEFGEMNDDEIKKEGLNYIDNLKESYIINKRRELQKAMQEAEEKGDAEKIEELTKKFNQLI